MINLTRLEQIHFEMLSIVTLRSNVKEIKLSLLKGTLPIDMYQLELYQLYQLSESSVVYH